jgi:hypothetical protein
VHYTRVFWVRRLGSTPLRKLWVQVQRVATSMRQARTSRRSGAKELFGIVNFTQRGPSIPCTSPELSQNLVSGSSVMPLLLRHSPSVMADSSRSHLADILTSRRRTAGTPTASIAVLVLVPDGWVQGQGPRGSIFEVPDPVLGGHPDPPK